MADEFIRAPEFVRDSEQPFVRAEPSADFVRAPADFEREKPKGNLLTRTFWDIMQPITSYPETYAGINRERQHGMSEGVDMITGTAERKDGESRRVQAVKGAGWTALNALGYGLSPIDAGLRTIVGKPIEQTTGIPKEYSELVAGLLIPGYGFTRLPGTQAAGKVVQKIFSPETLDVHAENAATLLRSATGRAARDTQTTDAVLEPFRARINQMDEPTRLSVINYIEGGNAAVPADIAPLATKLREAFALRKTRLQQLPSTAQAHFVDDYFPHFWTDPAAAQNFARGFGGASKQGSGASLHARTVPTIEDGIQAGLTPLTTDPIEATMRYVTSMDRFIASTKVLDTAKANGPVVYIKPKVMGASGHPNAFKVPDGYAPLEGRGARDATGGQAYAPEGFARVYNNFISKGFHEVEEYGQAYDTARRGTNAITALELGLSAYHGLTMMQEGIVNQVAKAIAALRGGRLGEFATEILKAPAAPYSLARKGNELQGAYLGTTPATQEMRYIADLLTEAGGRARGTSHAPDYEFSGMGSYVTSYKRAALGKELSADKAQIIAAPISGTAKVFGRHIGRVMSTVAQPLFEKYIPAVKNGAFYENMEQWLRTNPTAARDEQVRAARQIWDSVDNRFGEMVQDNVFWNKTLKQTAMLALRSWSWTVGGNVREIGGGVRDFVRAPLKTAQGIGPNDKRWTQKMDYVLALPLTYGAMSAVYQYLKTGEAPSDLQDLAAPRTGGVDANSGEPERLMMPGYMKDVFGFLEHPGQEAMNKIGTGPRMAAETAGIPLMGQGGSDWRGDPILSPPDREGSWPGNVPRWMGEYFDYLTNTVGPISIRNTIQGQKTGSKLNSVETLLGVRTAPRQFIDPEGHGKMLETIRERKWQTKQRHDMRTRQRYEGPDGD